MSKSVEIQKFEQERMKKDIPEFRVGDTLTVHFRIIDEGGKERIQAFTGTVVARKGSGISETITLHRIAYGEGMERVVFIHSPLIAKMEVVKKGKVRKSKLYYLRGKSGKAIKIKGRYEQEKEETAPVIAEASNVAG